jgi:hypothetical protein
LRLTISLRDIVYGLYGAWRLALLDRGGLVYFDRSVEGFWKSFFAAALIAPAYLALVAIDVSERGTSAGALRLLIVFMSAYVLRWSVYPLVTHAICQAIGRESAYIGFIVAFNWSQVLQMVVYLPIILFGVLGLIPEGVSAWLHVLIYSLILAYQWFVTRTALDIAPLAAVGFVALDLMLSIVITGMADGMVR